MAKTELDLLREVSHRLGDAGIAFMLTGSVAMNYYAQPRMTRDIDLVVALTPDDAEVVVRLFETDFYLPESPQWSGKCCWRAPVLNVWPWVAKCLRWHARSYWHHCLPVSPTSRSSSVCASDCMGIRSNGGIFQQVGNSVPDAQAGHEIPYIVSVAELAFEEEYAQRNW